MTARRTFFVAFLLAAVLAFAALWLAGSVLTKPMRQALPAPPTDLPIQSVSFTDSKNRQISGWYIANKTAKAGVILLHGIRSDRRSMLSRARFLRAHNYTVLLIDLAAHGKSQGDQITFGYTEADGVIAAIKYLRQKPIKKVAIIGSSLGGASAIIAAAREPQSTADAYIVEGVFSTLPDAIKNRLALKFGRPSGLLAPLLLFQIPLRLGFRLDDASPLKKISKLHKPVLIISGEKDKRTTLANTKQLFAAANQPKELWIIDNAGHVDLHHFAKQKYEKRVVDFLKVHLF